MKVSPRVSKQMWGCVEVDDADEFRDAKLFPGGARGWDWNETGTRHRPGVQIQDVEELVDAGATVIVLSRGVLGRLQVPAQTVAWLEERGVRVHVLPTPEAVTLYNELRREHPVGALLHSTC